MLFEDKEIISGFEVEKMKLKTVLELKQLIQLRCQYLVEEQMLFIDNILLNDSTETQ